jgi:hypothetical protein
MQDSNESYSVPLADVTQQTAIRSGTEEKGLER